MGSAGISRGGGSPAIRYGGGFGGFRGGFARQPGFRGGFGFRTFPRFGFYPFYYPGLYGYGGYGYGYDSYPDDSYPYDSYGYSDANGYGYADPGYAPSAPPVVIMQNGPAPHPPAPVVRLAPRAPGPQQDESSLYLVAFQDGVIRAALAYWADGASLHYVSLDHEQKTAPLSSVDRALSERLNSERNVAFRLPR